MSDKPQIGVITFGPGMGGTIEPRGTVSVDGKCTNCHKRPATENWVGTEGTLAFVRGLFARWCRLCCLREQLKHAEKAAESLPALRAEIAELEAIEP